MTTNDYYSTWVSLHTVRDTKSMSPLEVLGAFFMIRSSTRPTRRGRRPSGG